MPKMRLQDQAKASIFSCQKFIPFKTVVHILSAIIQEVFPNSLEPVLSLHESIIHQSLKYTNASEPPSKCQPRSQNNA